MELGHLGFVDDFVHDGHFVTGLSDCGTKGDDLFIEIVIFIKKILDLMKLLFQSEEEMEREVIEMLQKALKYCDLETPGSRQPVYQFRAANIQHRLASLYHRVYRNSDVEADTTKRKANLQLSKLYYEKSSKLLLALEQTVEYLTVQMERVALAEYQAKSKF